MAVPPANFTSPTNLTQIIDVVDLTNNYTGYMMGPVFIIVLFIISFTALISRPNAKTSEAMTASLWLCAVTGMFMSMLPNMLSPNYVLSLGAAAALSSFLLWARSGK